MIKFEVDLSALNAKLKDMTDLSDKLMPQVYEHFRDITPIRSGNARQNTHLQGNRIFADYPYAERLDQGYSNQAPDGMTQPTQEFLEQLVNKTVRDIGSRRS